MPDAHELVVATGGVEDQTHASEDAAAQELMKALVEDLRSSQELSPAEREGLLGWCGNWRDDFNADTRACEILVDAMARFTMHLKARGTSPRALALFRSTWIPSADSFAIRELPG